MGSGGSKDACNAIDCDSILNNDEKYRDLVNGREEYIIDKCCSKKKEKFTLYTDINRNINNDISHNINLIIIIIILVFSIFFLNQMR
jgi:hypothetical protein